MTSSCDWAIPVPTDIFLGYFKAISYQYGINITCSFHCSSVTVRCCLLTSPLGIYGLSSAGDRSWELVFKLSFETFSWDACDLFILFWKISKLFKNFFRIQNCTSCRSLESAIRVPIKVNDALLEENIDHRLAPPFIRRDDLRSERG